MKRALILLIFISLYSFLSAIQCLTTQKVGCKDNSKISSCGCYPKNYGSFSLTYSCTSPKRPTCHIPFKLVVCYCS